MKILISEYNFAVNVVVVINDVIHEIFIIRDLVSKLLITKLSSAKILMFNALVLVKAYADQKVKGKT